MHIMPIDVETFSEINLKTDGAYKYVAHHSFEILLFTYALNTDPEELLDLTERELPGHVIDKLISPNYLKTAWNAAFEFEGIDKELRHKYGVNLIRDQWECTMIRAANMSLPMKLDTAAKVLKLPIQKDFAGMSYIKYFCVPQEPCQANNFRTRNYPKDAPEKWEGFKNYNIKDVQVERAIRNQLMRVDRITSFEKKLYVLDQKINKTGVKVDTKLINNAVKINAKFQEEVIKEAQEITGIDKPTSVARLKKWLTKELELDEPLETLDKEAVKNLLKIKKTDAAERVLKLRQLMSKSSVSKYVAMANSVCEDLRVRGLLQFYGAMRTGRWAGRLIQVHNLPKNVMKALDYARELVRKGDIDTLKWFFTEIPYVLSQLIRTAFIPALNCRFLVSDFAAIEARVLAWLAGEIWRLEVFSTHGKIYEASAAQMFGIPIGDITEDSEWRQWGKIAELALGYGGSVGALTTMDTGKKLKEKDKKPLVDAWREANPNIVQFWYDVNDAAIKCIKTGSTVKLQKGIVFSLEKNIFWVNLPSGRKLAYVKPRLGVNRFGGISVIYQGVGDKKQWCDIETYGGKLVENIVQAISRDLLAEAMIRLDDRGYKIVMHVHDEIIIEEPIQSTTTAKRIADIMGEPIHWANGLPLKAKAYE